MRVRDERVAEHHIRIERQSSKYVLEATTDEAPTTVNGVALEPGERRALDHGDLIALSDLEFRFTNRREAEPLGRLWVIGGVHRGKTFRIQDPQAQIGRATHNDVQFPDRSVSRRHCRIEKRKEGWWIEDLGSTNGTLLGGSPLQTPEPLCHGDEIVAGYSRFVFQDGERPLANLEPEPLPPCN